MHVPRQDRGYSTRSRFKDDDQAMGSQTALKRQEIGGGMDDSPQRMKTWRSPGLISQTWSHLSMHVFSSSVSNNRSVWNRTESGPSRNVDLLLHVIGVTHTHRCCVDASQRPGFAEENSALFISVQCRSDQRKQNTRRAP